MIDTNEALARITIAEFEARQLKERSEEHARRWRMAMTIAQMAIGFGLGVYLQVTHWQISGAQVGAFLGIYLAGTAWEQHRMRETVRTLRAELDRLKEEIKAKA